MQSRWVRWGGVAALAAVVAVAGSRQGRASTPPWGTRVRLARVIFDPAAGVPEAPKPLAALAAAVRSTTAGAATATAAATATGVAAATDRQNLWLVQLRVPVTRAAQAQLGAVALKPLAVVPDDTYLMRGTAIAANQARRLRGVRAVAAMPLWAKVAKGVETVPAGTKLQVAVMPDSDAGQVAARLRAAGVDVAPVRSNRLLRVTAHHPAYDAATIAADPGVAAVTRTAKLQPMNAVARWVTQSAERQQTPLTDRHLTGTGEVGGVVDTGLDYYPDRNNQAMDYVSDCADPLHPSAATCKLADFTYQAPDGASCDGSGDYTTGQYAKPATNHRKVLAYFNEVAVCAATPGDSGASTHGSHVVGSVAGNQAFYTHRPDPADGIAPDAKIVFQDVGDDGESLAGLNDWYQLLAQAYEPGRVPNGTRGSSGAANPEDTVGPYVRGKGARVHSASIGSAVPAVGLGEASRADDFVVNNEDMLPVIAAGNSGPDQATTGEPGIAKDVLTSGAEDTGDADFGSIDALANFSSHGDAVDFGMAPNLHHIKPDVVDPGVRVISEKGGTNNANVVLQGTSMSTPVLSGTALLVRQYFEDGFGPTGPQGALSGFASGHKGGTAGFNPSAALVKAVIVNAGQRMRGKYTGTQGSQDSMNGQWPSVGQGWGRVEMDRALHFDDLPNSPDLWVNDTEYCPPPAHCTGPTGHGIETGDDATFTLHVGTGQPLKVILSWSDPGGVSSFFGFGPEDVVTNQLALQVDGPDGTQWCGNNINTMSDPSADVATSLEGSCNPISDDKFNNVQGVYLPTPQAGTYTVHVFGDAVLQDQNVIGLSTGLLGRQGYAIAATGRFTDVPAVAPVAAGAPTVTAATVTAPSNDLAVVHITTATPTVASVTLTPDSGAPVTLTDVYSRPASSFAGITLALIENDGAFLNRPVRGRDHLLKFTGLSPGTHYQVSYTVTGVPPGVTPLTPAGVAQAPSSGPTATGALSVTMPSTVYAPTVGADTATLYEANSDVGPPVPDVNDDTWGLSSQLYLGTLTATTDIACRVSGLAVCTPFKAGGAFKFRLPTGTQVPQVSGAAVLLTWRHDLTSHVLGLPTHTLALLAHGGEATWGSGATYQDVYGAPVDVVFGAPTTFRAGAYDVEAFTVSCADLPKVVAGLQDGQAAFRLEGGGSPGQGKDGAALGESLVGWDTGYGRRSLGLEVRPRLVLFGPSGDPLGQVATGAPVVTDVRAERVDKSTAVVHWHTDQPSNSLVLLRQGTGGDVVQVGSPAFVTDHHVTVTTVDAGAGWQFALRSTAPGGQVTTATNGGAGWLITDAATAVPGPAPAAAGGGGFAALATAPSDATASQAALSHGTGLACAPLVLNVSGSAAPTPGGGTSPPTGRSSRPAEAGALLLALGIGLVLVRRRSRI